MANGTLEYSAFDHPPARRRLVRRLRLMLRSWQRERTRRRLLRQLLEECHDPRVLEDAGFKLPPPTMFERWAMALAFLNH